MADGVGVPLRHDDDGLARPARALSGFGRRIPARVHLVVLRVAGADRRGEAQEVSLLEFAGGGLAEHLLLLRQRLRPDVGGEELRMAALDAEVLGHGVAVELLRPPHNLLIQRNHPLPIRGARAVLAFVRQRHARQPGPRSWP